MKYYHIIGLVGIVACTVCIGLNKPTPTKVHEEFVPMWIPVLLAILAPAFMTVNAMLIKHLTIERIGF